MKNQGRKTNKKHYKFTQKHVTEDNNIEFANKCSVNTINVQEKPKTIMKNANSKYLTIKH